MNDSELRLECLKLAMEQTRREATTDLNRVAELQIWFYNHIITRGDAPAPAAKDLEKDPGGRRRAQAADKSPQIFG